jgi:hypothetical protein
LYQCGKKYEKIIFENSNPDLVAHASEEKKRDGAGARVRADYRSDIIDFHFTVKMRKA